MTRNGGGINYGFLRDGNAETQQDCFRCGSEIPKRSAYFAIRENSYCMMCGTDILMGEIAEMAGAMDEYRLYWQGGWPKEDSHKGRRT